MTHLLRTLPILSLTAFFVKCGSLAINRDIRVDAGSPADYFWIGAALFSTVMVALGLFALTCIMAAYTQEACREDGK